MSEFWYVASNGRCGTQFLARQLGQLARDDERIVHEALALQMASREVFRDPEAIYRQIGRTPELQGFLVHMSNMLKKGIRNVNCGWPAFAWLGYFGERFGEAFRFVHLVRNPYDCAASHATHQSLMPGRMSKMELRCKLAGTDPNVRFRQFAERYDSFGIFERQLFHWLEVTTWLREHHKVPGFRGLIRFEDLVAPDTRVRDATMSLILGRDVAAERADPFDRVHRGSPWPIDFRLDPELQAAVEALAAELGYTPEALAAARDPARLEAAYSARRFDLPCDPRIAVVEGR